MTDLAPTAQVFAQQQRIICLGVFTGAHNNISISCAVNYGDKCGGLGYYNDSWDLINNSICSLSQKGKDFSSGDAAVAGGGAA